MCLGGKKKKENSGIFTIFCQICCSPASKLYKYICNAFNFPPDKYILILVVQLRLSDEGDSMKHCDTNELQTLTVQAADQGAQEPIAWP